MVTDKNKDITWIRYNHLNLPEEVQFADGNYVKYLYDAAGIKLQKEASVNDNLTITDYVVGKHYKNGSLEFFQHAEGRVTYNSGSFSYEYNLTDHLGNVRVTVDSAGNVIQKDDYYPFGLTFNSWTDVIPENQYKYNGKEEQQEWGVIDYGARMYQADLGRWFNVDPLADKYYSNSPYHYAYNNPLSFVDPDGREIKIGENIYAYEEDRDYDSIEDDFERNTYKALDKLYSEGAMKITIGEGEDAVEVDILQTLIDDTENTITIKKSDDNGSRYKHEDKTVEFNDEFGASYLMDPNKPRQRNTMGHASATGILSHELIHSYNHLNDEEYMNRRGDVSTRGQIISPDGENLSYRNAEEKYTTELGNQVLNNLGEDQRNHYGARLYKTISVGSIRLKSN